MEAVGTDKHSEPAEQGVSHTVRPRWRLSHTSQRLKGALQPGDSGLEETPKLLLWLTSAFVILENLKR